MNFFMDLTRWFLGRGTKKNSAPSQPVLKEPAPIPTAKELAQKAKGKPSPTFDFLKDNNSADFMIDLQSIRPLADQFDRAREDLLKELQRMAPPKKHKTEIFKDVA